MAKSAETPAVSAAATRARDLNCIVVYWDFLEGSIVSLRSQLIRFCSGSVEKDEKLVEVVEREFGTRRRNHRKRNGPLSYDATCGTCATPSQLSPNLREDPPSAVSLANIDEYLI